MKLNDILSNNFQAAEWEAKGYELPKYDIAAVAKKTHDEPTWVHFGAGNIFRAFPAAILNDALNTGKYDRGVIVAESFDYEIIDKAYRPYNNLSLLVSLQSNGTIEKKVIASVTESIKADKQFADDWARLVQIFQAPTLQMVTFTITEKGYSYNDADLARGLDAVFAMGKLTALLYERYKAGKLPLTLQSTDNCSHNGDHVKAGVKAYAERWAQDGIVEAGFVDYINDSSKITYPWSMIDKITPRPHEKVQAMLAEDGFEDNNTIITEKHTFTAPFVNAEEVQYLVCEDTYTNGRPPLELGRSVVIDSKVSLTAYSDALAAEDEAEQERLMKAHALSVRKHIDELAAKDYSKLVDDAIGFVLMFIPNETSYIAAMKQQPDLSRYAYQKKIIIISPSNLLMALQLAYNLWQYDRQNKNVEKIVKTAADLYDKVAGFEDTFMSVGDLITRLSGTFDKAKKQLYDGTGNVMRRVESLKGLGVTPKKQIKELDNL
jgi:hypothetical protein